jgi:hypothetical protein
MRQQLVRLSLNLALALSNTTVIVLVIPSPAPSSPARPSASYAPENIPPIRNLSSNTGIIRKPSYYFGITWDSRLPRINRTDRSQRAVL